VGVLGVLAAANALAHAHALGWTAGGGSAALRLGVDLLAVLVVVIGGRITPAFTRNALRRAGDEAPVHDRPALARLAIAAAAALAVADLVAPRTGASGAIAAVAALAVAGRMAGWQTRRTGRDPLVWSLHAGYGWLALGFALVAAGDLGAPVPAPVGLHAVAAGGLGTMVVAVMTRVGLGHTGRALVLPRGAAAIYALVMAGAALRVLGPLVAPEAYTVTMTASGVVWAAGFALFAALYAPILLRPRPDGQPG